MKEISNNFVVINLYKVKKIDDFFSYLIYLNVDKDKLFDLNKRTKSKMKLNKNKNSIKKINNDYFSVLLYNGGCLIINISTRKIEENIKDYNDIFYINEFKEYGQYLYYFAIKKSSLNNKVYEYKHYKMNNCDDFVKTLPTIEKKFNINIDNHIQNFEVIIFNNEENYINRFDVLAMLVIGEKFILINYNCS
jgi:hypothetical protein